VTTTAQFYTALSTAHAQAADKPFQIKLVQGTYAFGGYTSVPGSQISILGGYTDGTCTARHVDAANTVVDFGGTGFLTVALPDASPRATITVEGITFTHGEHVALQVGQRNQFFADDGGDITVRNVRFTGLTTSAGGAWDRVTPVTMLSLKGTISVTNSVFDHLNQAIAGAACAVDISLADADAHANLNFVSAEMSNGKSFCFDPDYDGDVSYFSIYNSIIWSTDNLYGTYSTIHFFDFVDDGGASPTIALVANTMSGYDGGGNVTEFATQSALEDKPLWINPVAGVSGDYGLLPTSSSINSAVELGPNGPFDWPTIDIASGPRPVGNEPDRGAVESPYVDNPSTVVTNTNDSGAGSLRAAISTANIGNDLNKITFQLPNCPSVIKLKSQLNVNSPVFIDGYANAPAKLNDDLSAFNATLCVIIEEETPGSVLSAINSSSSLTLRGVAFSGFLYPLVLGGADNTVTGNQFGGSVGGYPLYGASQSAIWVKNLPSGNVAIGGTSPGERNVISGASKDGIFIDSSVTTTHCQVAGNLIGLGPNGVTEAGNEFGIEVRSTNCQITGNRIASNLLDGIWINGGKFNRIQANSFGLNAQGNATQSYGWAVRIDGTNNIVGAPNNVGYAPGLGNAISFMDTGGVLVNGINNSVRGNLSDFNGYANDGSAPDIKLTANGNFQQPFPVIDNLSLPNGLPTSGPVAATISGHLKSGPSGLYRIDVYYSPTCSPAGRGHADYYLESKAFTTDAAGNVTFSIPVTLPVSPATSVLSLAATDAYADSSEIGSCFAIDKVGNDVIFKNGFNPLP
jgi:parallel beta-helix repeat protein